MNITELSKVARTLLLHITGVTTCGQHPIEQRTAGEFRRYGMFYGSNKKDLQAAEELVAFKLATLQMEWQLTEPPKLGAVWVNANASGCAVAQQYIDNLRKKDKLRPYVVSYFESKTYEAAQWSTTVYAGSHSKARYKIALDMEEYDPRSTFEIMRNLKVVLDR